MFWYYIHINDVCKFKITCSLIYFVYYAMIFVSYYMYFKMIGLSYCDQKNYFTKGVSFICLNTVY